MTRLTSTNDIKIFILFILNSVNKPMRYADINEVSVEDGIVAGLDFADCFADLVETGNIREIRQGEESLYELSPQGKIVAESLQEDIPKWVRSQGVKSAFRLMNYRERGSKISTRYTLRDDGKYDLCCQIIDEKQLSLEIRIVVESVKQLELMMYNFDDRPEVMYRGVLALLCGDMEYLVND